MLIIIIIIIIILYTGHQCKGRHLVYVNRFAKSKLLSPNITGRHP